MKIYAIPNGVYLNLYSGRMVLMIVIRWNFLSAIAVDGLTLESGRTGTQLYYEICSLILFHSYRICFSNACTMNRIILAIQQ